MAKPTSGMTVSASDMAEPITDMAEPITDMAEPISDMAEYASDMAEPISCMTSAVNDPVKTAIGSTGSTISDQLLPSVLQKRERGHIASPTFNPSEKTSKKQRKDALHTDSSIEDMLKKYGYSSIKNDAVGNIGSHTAIDDDTLVSPLSKSDIGICDFLVHDVTTDTVKLNINTCKKSDIKKIIVFLKESGVNMIGPERINSIIEYRETNGDYTNIDQITKVDRIGFTCFKQLQHAIAI
jgi:competence ComEA-like helix-hairpin-helix protein